MDQFALLPFAVFCAVASGTPGPNNTINLAQGVRLGFRGAMPFAIGAGLGVASLLMAVSLGLGTAFRLLPWLHTAMTVVATVFLVYLAWKIATAGPLSAKSDVPRVGLLGGFGFQWVNPKTWAATTTMATTYLPPDPSLEIVGLAGLIFCLIGWLTQPIWIAFGTALRSFLADTRRASVFNALMAALLLLATLPILLTPR